MALGDSYFVLTDLLQAPNNELIVAAPHVAGLHLPQLQGVTFQDVLLGYGDLFVAGVLGGVLAREGRRFSQQCGIAVLEGGTGRPVRPAVLRPARAAGDPCRSR